MHGLAGTALAGTAQNVMAGGDMAAGHGSHDALPAAPAQHGPHHGPAAFAHHPCLATPAASASLHVPAAEETVGLPLLRHASRSPAPARARPERAPPDLNNLCVSRT